MKARIVFLLMSYIFTLFTCNAPAAAAQAPESEWTLSMTAQEGEIITIENNIAGFYFVVQPYDDNGHEENGCQVAVYNPNDYTAPFFYPRFQVTQYVPYAVDRNPANDTRAKFTCNRTTGAISVYVIK